MFLTHGQLESLADAAGRGRLPILFLGYTGVRYGEMAALRVRHLDLLRRRALIAEAVADVNGRAVFDTPKNHQRRSVSLPTIPGRPVARTDAARRYSVQDHADFLRTKPVISGLDEARKEARRQQIRGF